MTLVSTQRFAPRVLLLTGVLLLVSVGVTLADDSADDGRRSELLFQIDRNSSTVLRPFDGALVGLERLGRDHGAWRMTLALSGTHRDDDRSIETNVSTNRLSDERTEDGISVGLAMLRLSYPMPEARVRGYYGVGPALRVSHTSTELSHTDTGGSPVDLRQEYETLSWSAGLQGVLGAKWYFHRAMCLLAEYGVEGVFLKSDGDLDDRDLVVGLHRHQKIESESLELGSTGVIVGFGVRF